MTALTVKQQGVCDLVAEGLSAKEISARLGISPRTVEAHRREIYHRMGVRNAVELVRVLFSSEGKNVHG
jgi:DNA-binding NarL/FixJ family response regulator